MRTESGLILRKAVRFGARGTCRHCEGPPAKGLSWDSIREVSVAAELVQNGIQLLETAQRNTTVNEVGMCFHLSDTKQWAVGSVESWWQLYGHQRTKSSFFCFAICSACLVVAN